MRAGLAKIKTMVMQFMLDVFGLCTIHQGCARLRKIEGGPKARTCEIQGARKITSMKKAKIFWSPGSKS